jgi:hypothetical protein
MSLTLAALVVALGATATGRAAAGGDACDDARAKARDLEERAQRGGPDARAEWQQVGNTYLDAWHQHVEQPMLAGETAACSGADALLEGAAGGFQHAGLASMAIAVWKQVLKPENGLAQTAAAKKAPYALGELFAGIAIFDQAASWYEKVPAGDPHAADALAQAVAFRLALGQEDLASADVDRFAKERGAAEPRRAAELAYALASRFADERAWPRARQAIETHLPLFDGPAAPFDVWLQAHALLARTLVSLRDPRGPAEYAKVDAAWADPDAAVQRIRHDAPDKAFPDLHLGSALSAVSEARFFAAEVLRATTFERVRYPVYRGSGSADDVSSFVQHAVAQWFKDKIHALVDVEVAYLAVTKLEPAATPTYYVRASCRDGEMWADIAEAAARAPTPKEWAQDRDVLDAYNRALDEAIGPVRDRAKTAMVACLDASARHDVVTHFTFRSEQFLAAYFKSQYPVFDDRYGAYDRGQRALGAPPAPLDAHGEPAGAPTTGATP